MLEVKKNSDNDLLSEGEKALEIIKDVTKTVVCTGLGAGIVLGKSLFNLSKGYIKSGLDSVGTKLKDVSDNIDLDDSSDVMDFDCEDYSDDSEDEDDDFDDFDDFEDFDEDPKNVTTTDSVKKDVKEDDDSYDENETEF